METTVVVLRGVKDLDFSQFTQKTTRLGDWQTLPDRDERLFWEKNMSRVEGDWSSRQVLLKEHLRCAPAQFVDGYERIFFIRDAEESVVELEGSRSAGKNGTWTIALTFEDCKDAPAPFVELVNSAREYEHRSGKPLAALSR
jgi:hypothetical protein